MKCIIFFSKALNQNRNKNYDFSRGADLALQEEVHRAIFW